MNLKSFAIGGLASILILVSLDASGDQTSALSISEYRYVDESHSMFELECNRLIKNGCHPVGGMYTSSQNGTGKRFFIQAFVK